MACCFIHLAGAAADITQIAEPSMRTVALQTIMGAKVVLQLILSIIKWLAGHRSLVERDHCAILTKEFGRVARASQCHLELFESYLADIGAHANFSYIDQVFVVSKALLDSDVGRLRVVLIEAPIDR